MARPRQPISLLEAKNKKHLTKAEIETRKASEIKAPSDNVTPPKYLSTAQKREFKKYATQLVDLKIFSNLDVDSLAAYLISRDLWVDYTKQITEALAQEKKDLDHIEQLSRLQDKAFKQTRAAASDNGLTISSRCRLIVPDNKEQPKQNKFTQKFGGGASG